ncbi:MAG: DUF1700 domain-containing protein [Lachnospiraceae bacterium]|nr:DUF1700 domain-containing protein [Lachnospiraceae bacterium]
MDKQQFLAELKQLLGDIPAVERDEALEYYEDYFEDAGSENESTILKELESPEKIAFMIKAGLRDSDKSIGEFTETGFSGYGPAYKDEVANTIPNSDDRGFTTRRDGKGMSLLLIILLVLAAPIWVPVAFGLLAALFGISLAVFAWIFAIAIAGIGCIVVGAIILIVGVPGIFTLPAGGILITGLGLLTIGIGILLTMAGTALILKAVPAVLKLIAKLIGAVISKFSLYRKGRVEV